VQTQSVFLKETEELRDLRVLEEIERNPHVSQRELASSLGVALGIANACVHTLVRKGLIKIRGESNRSITYHVTKQGLAHKARLALQWTANTIDFYRQARSQVSSRLATLRDAGVQRALLYGADEVAELAVMVAPEVGIEIVGVVAPEGPRVSALLVGLPVRGLEAVADGGFDSVIAAVAPSEDGIARLADALADARAVAGVYALTGQTILRPGARRSETKR